MSDESTLVQQAETKANELATVTTEVLATAENFSIVTTEQYTESTALLKVIKGRQKELDELRRSLTRPLDEAKSRIMNLFKPAADQLAKAEGAIKGAVLTFTKEQERLRREEELRLREEAEKEAERLRKRAEKARAKGQEERAEDLETQAETLPVPIVVPQMPAAQGIALRTTWHAAVTDFPELVLAVARTLAGLPGGQPITLLIPNMTVLNAQARALKNELSIPGVQAVPDEGVAARSS